MVPDTLPFRNERVIVRDYLDESGRSPFEQYIKNAKRKAENLPLTRDYRVTIYARLQKDASFRREVLREALQCMLNGEIEVGKTTLRDYIHGTIGFLALGAAIGKSSKSLMRMFGRTGNPQAKNLFDVIAYLQEAAHITLQVEAKEVAPKQRKKPAAPAAKTQLKRAA
jgi:hypothetical protein